MNDAEQIDIISILKKTFYAFKEEDVRELRRLSDHITEDASIFQDDYSISLAIILYTLSKILEKEKYQNYKEWKSFYKNCLGLLDNLKKDLEKSNFDIYSKDLQELLSLIKDLDKKVPLYIEELLNSSRIKKGSNLYGYGLSLGRAAELLGISKWELMGYVGNINLPYDSNEKITAKDRYNNSLRIFGVK